MAMTDHLTAVANRVRFERTLDAEMAYTRRTGEPFTLLCVDLDGFKEVNDGHGDAAGEEVVCMR